MEEDQKLDDFVVASRKRKREDDEDDQKEDSESDVSAEEIPDDDVALTELLKQEASKIVGDSLSTTVVNGRTLRDRTKIAAPTDAYLERFGKRTLQKLAVSEHKREMLDDLKAWKKEFQSQDPTFVWLSLTLKDSVETIESFHQNVIDKFELELADDDEELSEEKSVEEDATETSCAESEEDSSDDEDDDEDSSDDESEDDSSDDETTETDE